MYDNVLPLVLAFLHVLHTGHVIHITRYTILLSYMHPQPISCLLDAIWDETGKC